MPRTGEGEPRRRQALAEQDGVGGETDPQLSDSPMRSRARSVVAAITGASELEKR